MILPPPAELTVSPQPIAQPTVFVVDDDEAVLNSLKFSLEFEGFKVRVFRSSSAILQEPAFQGIGCLVLDFKLPGQDGLKTLATLRVRGVEWPAILITSNPSPDLRRRARAAGVPIVEKPQLAALPEGIRSAMASTRPTSG